MAGVSGFEEIKAWQKTREMTRMIYQVSKRGDFYKDFGLRDQIRRATSSVMSNIAEGYERDGNREFVQFLSQAKGSCGEIRSQLYMALDQNYLTPAEFEVLKGMASEVSRMISGLMAYLQRSEQRGRKYQTYTK